jgi:hypothetical protein
MSWSADTRLHPQQRLDVNDVYIIQDQLAEMDFFLILFQWEYTNVHGKGLSTVFKICQWTDHWLSLGDMDFSMLLFF